MGIGCGRCRRWRYYGDLARWHGRRTRKITKFYFEELIFIVEHESKRHNRLYLSLALYFGRFFSTSFFLFRFRLLFFFFWLSSEFCFIGIEVYLLFKNI